MDINFVNRCRMAFHPFTTTHSELEVNCQPYIVENSKKEGIQLNQYNGILHSLNTVLEKEECRDTKKTVLTNPFDRRISIPCNIYPSQYKRRKHV